MSDATSAELGEVLSQPIGAKFHRADLHIHSYGASHDVKDASMTAEGIVGTAIQEGLSLIAVTDHNDISNVGATISVAGKNIYVVPGVELSTPQAHILCYLPTLEALQRFYGQLSIVDKGESNSRCQQSLLDCLNLVDAGGGFAILAHVDVASGYEFQTPGASPHKLDIFCHRALLGIEIKLASSAVVYSDADTVPNLLKAIADEDISQLTALTTPEGVQIFKSDEAQIILERLGEPAVRFQLERVALFDLPRLQITRSVSQPEGKIRYVHREFSKLSLGQQQSVLLALMLASDSDRPLIIDQPEDNLDGEFIYKTLVPVLRRAKERRQVIIVTHNPNVAILGDAELIIVLKAMNDRGLIVTRGSIDQPQTRDAACAILEGAREAFLRRAKIYGVHFRDS